MPALERQYADSLWYMPAGDCSPGFMSPAGIYQGQVIRLRSIMQGAVLRTGRYISRRIGVQSKYAFGSGRQLYPLAIDSPYAPALRIATRSPLRHSLSTAPFRNTSELSHTGPTTS